MEDTKSTVSKGRILLVDDEPYILLAMEEVLAGDGYTVECVADAESALTVLEKTPFHLVITDVRLGGRINGLAILQHMKKSYPDAHCIIITSFGTMEIAIKAMRMGAYDFITKPFDDIEVLSISVKRVFEKINLVMENRRLVDQLKIQNQKLTTTNSELEKHAKTDVLTGLFNRRFFQSFIEKEILRSERHQYKFALLFLDLDNFKHYNDAHGHVAGDTLLAHTAKCITNNIRRSDVAARYGGEEFVVILIQTELEDAVAVAEKIRQSIDVSTRDNPTLPEEGVTASIGVAIYPEQGTELMVLIENSDKALYKAKSMGKNCVHTAS